jgi:hypothetical protein
LEFIIMPQFIFQRGETISLALDALTGDPLTVSDVSAVMKAVAPGRTSVAPDAPVAAAFAIQARAADAENPAGWTLSIPALVSSTLQPGVYAADARLEMANGDIIVSETVDISVRPSVTA